MSGRCIVGIDPGYSRIGYAAVDVVGNEFHARIMGTWEIPRGSQSSRLEAIETLLSSFLDKVRPSQIGIEKLFFSKNTRTAMAVAEARGVIVLAAGRQGVPLIELTPNEVKRAVTGTGAASKASVARMARWIAKISDGKTLDDATDALAIAIAASRQTFPKD